ncbi:beta-galactosidase small subunit [Spirochaeta cellobiosiphila]|uniref:beta-galactosidase small subunit n=1 Tax=Spirochaeta cellobiosiphila TaxID=504483 RepID=UPI0004092EC3|nr:beta-galactosidase small subunit [Spirochaeta cellobiosiphila]
MRCVLSDVFLGLHGDRFEYLFSYDHGGPESIVIDHMQWLYRSPKPTYWRGTTCNDRGNGFGQRSHMWVGADLFTGVDSIQIIIDGQELPQYIAPYNNTFRGTAYETPKVVCIKYTYTTCTNPSTKVEVSYTITEDGNMTVDVHYHGKEGLPELPLFGIRFILPRPVESFIYKGLSGETYPDRRMGGIPGTYKVEGLPMTPYLVPQDCGMHIKTEYVTLRQEFQERKGTLTFAMKGQPFAFSALPYTALEIENATHQEELPPVRRTVLNILGAVRGVGGIDSWGSDVEEDFRIPGNKDIQYSFVIKP